MDESYMRESSPIETPGAILLEIIIADAVMSDAVVAGIEHKCLLPTSSEPTPLSCSKTSFEVPKCKNNRSSVMGKYTEE